MACRRRRRSSAPTRGQRVQGPVQQGRRAGRRGALAAARAAARRGSRSVRCAVRRPAGCSRSSSWRHGDGPRGQLEQGQQLRHRLDDLGDGGGRVRRRAGWASDQASKRATQPRSTALSSRSQARSRQPGRAVSPCSSTRPASRAVSQSARTCRASGPVRRRPVRRSRRTGRHLPVGSSPRVAARAQRRRRPSGRSGPRRPDRARQAGQFRGGAGCPPAARGAAGSAPLVTRGGRWPEAAGGRVGAWSRAGYGTSREQSSG